MCQGSSRCLAAVLSALLLGASTTASALRVNGKVGVDLNYTDNAALVPSNESDDLITTGSIAGSVSEDQGPLTGNASASLKYIDYLDNTFGTQTYLNIATAASWAQVTNVLKWDVSDYYSQTSINNLAADTPGNTEDINVFDISPQLTLRPAERHTVTLTPSFRDFYYETTSNDNRQTGLAADWSYQLRPTVSVSLSGAIRKVDYDDDTLAQDNTNTNLNIGTTIRRARSDYALSVGATKVDRDSGADTDGFAARLAALYRLSGHSSVNANVSTDITDTSSIYLASSMDPNSGNFGNVQTSQDVVRNSVARLAYNREGSAADFSAWVELRKLNYETTPNDRKVQEYGARIGYRLSPRLKATLRGRYVESEEENMALTDKYFNADGQLAYALSRKLNANAGVRIQNRDNTDPLREFDAYSVFAGLGYRLGR